MANQLKHFFFLFLFGCAALAEGSPWILNRELLEQKLPFEVATEDVTRALEGPPLIGLMGAMHEEIAHLKPLMDVAQIQVIGGREYIRGKLFGIDTVLVFSRWGKVAAAATAATLIAEYQVDQIIFTGVAGATAKHLNIGDVVIATHLYQHDMDASPLFAKLEVPFLSLKFFGVDPFFLNTATKAAHSFFENKLPLALKKSTLDAFSIQNPSVYQGIIASGDRFISDLVTMESLLQEVPDTLAVEMEGASVAQVCFEHEIPFMIIRTISDRADHTAPIDFQKFVREIAMNYSAGIIQELYPLL